MPLVSKSFSDIITFSRGSNATYFDSAGVLKYAPNNAIRNNTGVGAVAGTPGTAPTNWQVTGSVSGITREIIGIGTEGGIAYIDVKYSGTPTTNTIFQVIFEANNQIAATPRQTWTQSQFVRVAAGALTNITSFLIVLGGRDSGGTNTGEQYSQVLAPTSAALELQRSLLTATFSNAATAFLRPSIQFNVTSGAAIDITLRIGLPQLEIGDTAGPAIPTSGTAYYGPRFDYNPATLAAQGLLIEEQRTNTATYSTEFQNAVYLVGPVGDDVTITDNAVTSPDGTSNAATYIEGTASTSHSRLQRVSGLTANGVYTISLFVKYNSGSRGFALGFGSSTSTASFNSLDRCTARWDTLGAGPATATPSNGTIAVISTNAVDVGNGWFRLSMAFTFDTTNTNTSFAFGFGITSSSLAIGTTGDGSSYSIYGFQLEAGSFPTSYIPTTTTALTRAADVASVNTLSPWYNAAEGTLYAEYTTLASSGLSTARIWSINDNSTSNAHEVFGNVNTRAVMTTSGVSQADSSDILTDSNSGAKISYAYATNNWGYCVKGGSVSVDTSCTVPSVSQLNIFDRAAGDRKNSGHIQRITYYPRRLSNAELQAITS